MRDRKVSIAILGHTHEDVLPVSCNANVENNLSQRELNFDGNPRFDDTFDKLQSVTSGRRYEKSSSLIRQLSNFKWMLRHPDNPTFTLASGSQSLKKIDPLKRTKDLRSLSIQPLGIRRHSAAVTSR